MKEVLLAIDIIINSSAQEIIRQNNCQMRFLDQSVLKQNFDKKSMINSINCLILESPSTSDYDDMENGVSKSTVLEPTIKHVVKYTSCGSREALNLVRRRQNIKSEISQMGKSYL